MQRIFRKYRSTLCICGITFLVVFCYYLSSKVYTWEAVNENAKDAIVLPSSTNSEYIALWNFASDLKHYWMLVRSSLKEQDVSKRRKDVIQDGYRALQNQIERLARPTAKAKRMLQVAAGTDALGNAHSDFKKFWATSQSAMRQSKVTKSAFKKINGAYRSVDQKIAKLMNLSLSKRRDVIEKLSTLVRRNLEKLQYPEDCSKARLQICEVMHPCGYGCQLHWVTNCMMNAFEKQRTVVYITKGWSYAEKGWEYTFLPIGKCTYDGYLFLLPGVESDDSRVVRWRKKDRTGEVSYTIPAKLAPSLMAVHGQPDVWWISQFVSYTTRYQPWIEQKIEKVSAEIGFKRPVVGIQIRRGDKVLDEARKIEVGDYMFFVEQWFLEYEITNKGGKRIVYVATDGDDVVSDLQKNYPDYTFIMNNREASDAHDESSLEEILLDLHFLSRSDYVVCSFSSNVCRAVYELMTSLHPDASKRIQSVDNAYFFTDWDIPMTAILKHRSERRNGELEFNVGDDIRASVNAYLPSNDGFLRGKNLATEAQGKFPAYKVRGTIHLRNFTIFDDVSLS